MAGEACKKLTLPAENIEHDDAIGKSSGSYEESRFVHNEHVDVQEITNRHARDRIAVDTHPMIIATNTDATSAIGSLQHTHIYIYTLEGTREYYSRSVESTFSQV